MSGMDDLRQRFDAELERLRTPADGAIIKAMLELAYTGRECGALDLRLDVELATKLLHLVRWAMRYDGGVVPEQWRM